MNLQKIIRAVLSRLGIWWEYYYIMTASIDIDYVNKKLEEYSVKIPYDIIELSYSDFEKGDSMFCTQKKIEKYQRWFKGSNRKAYGVFIDDELAYSSWISYKDIEITNKTKLTGFAEYALLQDAYTHRKYRGKGLHNYVNLFRLKKIYDEGNKEKAIGIVRTKNTPAFKVQSNSDLKISGRILLLSIFGFEFIKRYDYDSK